MHLVRPLLAIAWLVFATTALVVWFLMPAAGPWWLPFIAAIVAPSIVGVMLLILGAHKI